MRIEHFFVIGGASLQANLIKEVKKNFITHVFDMDENCFCKDMGDYFHTISIHEKEKILELGKEFKISGIATAATELGNITTCYVGEKLKLGTNTYECSLNTTDKSRMKKIFKANNIDCANYIELRNLSDLEKIKNFPVVIKPSDRSAGRGVVKCQNMSEVKKAFSEALTISYNKIVLCEEVLKGRQFSVECISSKGRHKIVTLTEEYLRAGKFLNDYLEICQLVPARLARGGAKKIKKVIFKCLNAFGVKYGASHIELKLYKNKNGYKVKIIEIATRMGGWRDELIKHSFGINYNELLVSSVLKKDIQSLPTKAPFYCLVKFIFTKEDYDFFKKMKEKYPEMVVSEQLHEKEPNFSYASSLLDSKGYYYLRIPFNDNPDNYIYERI